MSEIDTGDIVFHKPTGETWIVACVQDQRLSWVGWPCGWAEVDDCELLERASDAEREELLNRLAKMNQGDHRRRYARHKLGLEP